MVNAWSYAYQYVCVSAVNVHHLAYSSSLIRRQLIVHYDQVLRGLSALSCHRKFLPILLNHSVKILSPCGSLYCTASRGVLIQEFPTAGQLYVELSHNCRTFPVHHDSRRTCLVSKFSDDSRRTRLVFQVSNNSRRTSVRHVLSVTVATILVGHLSDTFCRSL
jgi:hypothetical protein